MEIFFMQVDKKIQGINPKRFLLNMNKIDIVEVRSDGLEITLSSGKQIRIDGTEKDFLESVHQAMNPPKPTPQFMKPKSNPNPTP